MEATRRLQQEDYCGLVLTYRVNDTLLCVPVEHVDSVVEPPALTEIPNAPNYVMGAFMHHGKAALALSLKKLLRLPSTGEHGKKESLLVVWMGDQPIGYWVDEIKGMTDSGRGHWSAVPALIRDQGITRALVCDGQVYFPLDLTQSSQFEEIFHTLEAFEKHRVHEVTEEDVERAQQEALRKEQQAEALAEPEPEIIEEDDYVVADYPPADDFDEAYAEGIETTAFAEHEPEVADKEAVIDTSILARQMYEARFKEPQAEVIPEIPELDFDEEGQADAFLSERDAFADTVLDEAHLNAEEVIDEFPLDDNQLDAFDPDYQVMLQQEYEQYVETLYDENGQADAFLSELDTQGESAILPGLAETEDAVNEVYIDENQLDAFDPGYQDLLRQEYEQYIESLYDENGQADAFLGLLNESGRSVIETLSDVQDEASNDIYVDENQLDAFDSDYLHMLEQESIEALQDEQVEDEADLEITEEPYSYLPTTLPEDDELIIDEPVSDEQVEDEGDLEITEEPYSYLPTTLPEDDELILDEPVSDEQPEVDEPVEDETDLEITEEPYSYLPTSLPEDDDELVSEESLSDEQDDTKDISIEEDTQPTALLPYKEPEELAPELRPAELPDMGSTIARADYYADRYVESYADEFEALSDEQKASGIQARGPQPIPEKDDGFVSDIPYELDLDVEEEIEEEEPLQARVPVSPLPGGIIIRPDGQVSKSFGLIKVFTIVLATSAAGAWWFRDELFHREHIRKEIPSILQNEIAYLYSERVRIENPPKGKTRMLVETPDEEITVIKRKYVNRDVYREGRKKGVKLHRVRRGDTLWDIAKKYLADPYRYPELAENNRIHNPNLIRPGDVVKIKVKQAKKK